MKALDAYITLMYPVVHGESADEHLLERRPDDAVGSS
jgi:hypothetical protein